MDQKTLCNSTTTSTHPSCRDELDWSNLTDKNWNKRTTFQSYVKLTASVPCVPGQASLFPDFNRLPAELQVHVLSFCSPSTLFQAMHASSVLRVEASKLFWAKSDAYYVVEAPWLYRSGGDPGRTLWDVTFMSKVQQVELEYNFEIYHYEHSRNSGNPARQQSMAEGFWASFKERFPDANKVVINCGWKTVIETHPEPILPPLDGIVGHCPAEIEVRAFVTEKRKRNRGGWLHAPLLDVQRTSRQLTADGGWVETQIEDGYTAVMMPAKRFNGPVGEFNEIQYDRHMLRLQEYSLPLLAVEAIQHHHFGEGRDDPFHCRGTGCICNKFFSKAEEWMLHAVEHYHDAANSHILGWWFEKPRTDCLKNNLSDGLRTAFERRIEELRSRNKELNQRCAKLRQKRYQAPVGGAIGD